MLNLAPSPDIRVLRGNESLPGSKPDSHASRPSGLVGNRLERSSFPSHMCWHQTTRVLQQEICGCGVGSGGGVGGVLALS